MNALEFLITAKDLASQQFEKLSAAVEKAGSKSEKWKAVASVASAAVVAGVSYMAKTSIDAYGDAEEKQQALQSAYKKFPALAHGNIEALRAYNTALQAKTGVDDDDLAGMESSLAMYGANQQQLQKLAPIVVDYAAKTGQSLQDAALAIGRATTGSAKALREVGIQYKANGVSAQGVAKAQNTLTSATQKAADAQRHLALLKAEDAGKSHLSLAAAAALTDAQIRAKRAADNLAKAHANLKTAQQGAADKGKALSDITGLLQKKVGGFAEDQAKTATGQMRIMGTEFQNIQETIGSILLPVFSALASVLSKVFEWLNAHRPVVVALVAIIGVLTLGIIALNVVMWGMAAAEAGVLWPILLIVAAIAAVIVIIVLLVANWNKIVSFLKTVWNAVVNWVIAVLNGFAKWWNSLWGNILGFFKNLWNLELLGWKIIINAVVNWVRGFFNGFANWWNGFWHAIGAFISNVWNNGIVAPIRNAINWVVNFIRLGLMGLHIVWGNIWNGLIGIVRNVMDGVIGAVQNGINGAIDIVNGLIGAFNTVAGLVHIHVSTIPHVSLPHFATGTGDAPGGFAVVGENGPEIMNVPRHSMITPHGRAATVRLHPEDIQAIMRGIYAMIQQGTYVALGDALGG